MHFTCFVPGHDSTEEMAVGVDQTRNDSLVAEIDQLHSFFNTDVFRFTDSQDSAIIDLDDAVFDYSFSSGINDQPGFKYDVFRGRSDPAGLCD
jgi:hypothetical protein